MKFYFSLIYFAEKDAVAKWSFMDSFWWGLMVLTTVGYGARAPHTFAGQVMELNIQISINKHIREGLKKMEASVKGLVLKFFNQLFIEIGLKSL